MNSKLLTSTITLGVVLSTMSHGYEVWMGMHGTPVQAGQAANLPSWSKTATDSLAKAGIQGINGAKTAVVGVPGTSTENYTAPSTAQFKNAVLAITHRDNAILELPRDSIGAVGMPVDIAAAMDSKFADAAARGFVITRFMLHGSPNANNWSESEIGALRAELDAREAADPTMPHVRMGFLSRDNSVSTQRNLLNEAIEFLALEISPDLWNNSGAGRLAHLQWFWGNPTLPAGSSNPLGSKDVFLQIFAYNDTTSYGVADAYQSTRLLVRQIGLQIGPGFIASSRVIISPTVNGNPSYVPFFPETEVRNGIPDGKYSNTRTGIVLSLLEQKSYFHAAAGATESRCRSSVRLVSP
jgi:hypothetical protein